MWAYAARCRAAAVGDTARALAESRPTPSVRKKRVCFSARVLAARCRASMAHLLGNAAPALAEGRALRSGYTNLGIQTGSSAYGPTPRDVARRPCARLGAPHMRGQRVAQWAQSLGTASAHALSTGLRRAMSRVGLRAGKLDHTATHPCRPQPHLWVRRLIHVFRHGVAGVCVSKSWSISPTAERRHSPRPRA